MTLELRQVGKKINSQWIVEDLTMTIYDNEKLQSFNESTKIFDDL